jgi:hypothetical protein
MVLCFWLGSYLRVQNALLESRVVCLAFKVTLLRAWTQKTGLGRLEKYTNITENTACTSMIVFLSWKYVLNPFYNKTVIHLWILNNSQDTFVPVLVSWVNQVIWTLDRPVFYSYSQTKAAENNFLGLQYIHEMTKTLKRTNSRHHPHAARFLSHLYSCSAFSAFQKKTLRRVPIYEGAELQIQL